MKYLLLILSMSILLSGELEVDGNLTVTGTIEGTIKNDSLAQVIAQLEARIAQLECLNSGNIPSGYCDCFGNTLDICGVCNGDSISEDECVLTDIDGNIYETVEIGNQIWMKENLKTMSYRSGQYIQAIGDPSQWSSAQSGAYCNINNTVDFLETYGRLYNWYAVDDDRGLCMEGWHVPSDGEYMELEMFLGMSEEDANSNGFRGTDEGAKLKEAGFQHWEQHDTAAGNNESGFTTLPGGIRDNLGDFIYLGQKGEFWTSTIYSNNHAWHRTLYYDNTQIFRNTANPLKGMSVRCIKD